MEYKEGPKNKSIKSIVKAMNVINLLAESDGPLSLSSMAKSLNLSKSTLHGIISTLVDTGFIIQVPQTGHYQLSLRLFEIGNLISNQWNERKVAYPYIQKIVAETKETVHMAILDHNEVLYINKQESGNSIRIVTQVGLRLPAHCTGVGKMLLSGLSRQELLKLVKQKGLKKYTNTTLTDFDALYMEMEKIRKQGYATDEQEFMEGLKCIAVPIRNAAGKVSAALSISGPVGRMQGDQFERNKRSLLNASREISVQLGYTR